MSRPPCVKRPAGCAPRWKPATRPPDNPHRTRGHQPKSAQTTTKAVPRHTSEAVSAGRTNQSASPSRRSLCKWQGRREYLRSVAYNRPFRSARLSILTFSRLPYREVSRENSVPVQPRTFRTEVRHPFTEQSTYDARSSARKRTDNDESGSAPCVRSCICRSDKPISFAISPFATQMERPKGYLRLVA